MGHAVPYPQLVAGQLAEEAMNLLPRSRWWHWVVYPLLGLAAAALLLIGVVVVTSGQ